MTELSPALADFLDAHIVGVLVTDPRQGHARPSVVYYVRDGSQLLISTVATRHKALDVAASAWAALCVMGLERPFPSATFSGPAEIRTKEIGAATALVAQRFMGAEQTPEPQTDAALAGVGRVILAITIERVASVSFIDVDA